jgi:hypothetical protein
VNETTDPRRRSNVAEIEYLLARYHLRGHAMRLRTDAARWMGGPTTTNLRVSDAERNEVADRLSRHFADGRIDQGEFKERLDAAMAAKTQGDLVGLFNDLPPLDAERPSPPSRHRRLVLFVLMVVILALAAGSTFSVLHMVRIPWLLVAVVALLLWHRAGGRHRFHR